MRIVIIGSGNTATYLGRALRRKGHRILAVWSRKPAHARRLARKLGAPAVSHIRSLPDADLYILAVSDDSIRGLASRLRTGALVVHTSGSRPMNDLRTSSDRIGVLYPLQTFSEGRTPDLSRIPFLIEASGKKELHSLRKLVSGMGAKAYVCSTRQRKKIHLAAVIASNFGNHLLSLAFRLCGSGWSSLFRPLMDETLEKAFLYGPGRAQTGPARRNDRKVIREHLRILRSQRDIMRLYRLMSRSISNTRKSK